MRSALSAALIVAMTGAARADEPAPMYACHAPAADAKITVQFKPETSIRDLVTWAVGFTCKNIVLSSEAERAAPRVTILAPKPLTPKQALALFVDTLETAGLVVTVKADSILIKPGASLPQHCPEVSSAAPPTGSELSPYPSAAPPKDPNQKLIDEGVYTSDDVHYEVSRPLAEAVFAKPAELAKQARLVPAVANGKPDGIKLYAIRPDSVLAKLGIQNGDTLHTVNGKTTDTLDHASEAYASLRGAKKVEVQLVRRGKPLVLTYTVAPN